MNVPEKNWFEWAVFAIGLLLVIGVLAFLAYDGATLQDRPPAMEVRLGAAEQQADHFIIPVAVTNTGDQTAEGVLVEVTLDTGAEEPEQSQFEIAFLPRRSTREGWVAFQTDPRTAGEITARVIGYEQP
jgi:uncharacterized protein (TIGR02588 family)